MKPLNCILPGLLCLAANCTSQAQTHQPPTLVPEAQAAITAPQPHAGETDGILSAQREKRALQILFRSLQSHVVSAADAMPADKYGFAPTDGEFKGVRTFGQQVKHLAATNNILAAAALGENPPADAGDETGPETVRTKAEILDYLNSSFAHLSKAVDAIGDTSVPVRPSPISPLSATSVTRLSLIVESLIHAFDHYGQMVEYLRMNGVVPPASQP
jgi:uncharacterized damage-inducible protein DinB